MTDETQEHLFFSRSRPIILVSDFCQHLLSDCAFLTSFDIFANLRYLAAAFYSEGMNMNIGRRSLLGCLGASAITPVVSGTIASSAQSSGIEKSILEVSMDGGMTWIAHLYPVSHIRDNWLLHERQLLEDIVSGFPRIEAKPLGFPQIKSAPQRLHLISRHGLFKSLTKVIQGLVDGGLDIDLARSLELSGADNGLPVLLNESVPVFGSLPMVGTSPAVNAHHRLSPDLSHTLNPNVNTSLDRR